MHKRVILLTLLIGVSLFASSKKRGWLGVYTEEISEAAKIAIGVDYGALVTKVIEDSPAEKVEIEIGDVIMEIDGEKIEDKEDLRWLVKKRPNKKVKILLFRRGEEKKVDVVLGEKEREWWEELRKEWIEEIPTKVRRMEFSPLRKKELEKLKEEIEKLQEEMEKLKKEVGKIKT